MFSKRKSAQIPTVQDVLKTVMYQRCGRSGRPMPSQEWLDDVATRSGQFKGEVDWPRISFLEREVLKYEEEHGPVHLAQ